MNCIIVDDEEPAREDLGWFVKQFSSMKIAASFADGHEALAFLGKHEVDVVFLDIDMPKMDGMTLCKTLRGMRRLPAVVFVTAYREYAVEAFELEAFDYLLKPFREDRIACLLSRLESSASPSACVGTVAIPRNDSMVVVPALSIVFCEAQGHELRIVVKQEEYRMSSSISDFHRKLPADRFFRCHRSFLVNLSRIAEILPCFDQTYMLKLQDREERIPVSRRQAAEFRRLMGLK